MKCPTCNFENSDDSKFCCGCGKPFPCCPTCGNVITARNRFCVHDGTRLPDELLILVPEETETVEEVDVDQAVAADAMPVPEDTIHVPLENKPEKFCLRCGCPIWNGGEYCGKCFVEVQKTKPQCASCGMPCEPGQDYCAYCRPTAPIPVDDMDYASQATRERPAQKSKKKKSSALTAVLAIVLLLLIGAAAVLVAAEFDLIELPDIFGSEDSGRDRDRNHNKDRDKDQDSDDDDENPTGDSGSEAPTGDSGSEATTGTTPPETTVPTTTAATEPTTQPTEPPQTRLEYFMENCDSMEFTRADIVGFTKEECRYARNACYAQAGRKFNNKDLQTFFEQYYWYRPTYEPSYFDKNTDTLMNRYERVNRVLISEYEREMGFD